MRKKTAEAVVTASQHQTPLKQVLMKQLQTRSFPSAGYPLKNWDAPLFWRAKLELAQDPFRE
jgi:hypothetical protein